MSQELKTALMVMRKLVGDNLKQDFPITYLHDPETELPFGVLLDYRYYEELAAQAFPAATGIGELPHTHETGDD